MQVVFNEPKQLKLNIHLMAGWPLMLIIFGGAIGLVFGVIAYLINLRVYYSPLTKVNKILANLMCGMTAISAWWLCAQTIQRAF
jgi:hypothetical protein